MTWRLGESKPRRTQSWWRRTSRHERHGFDVDLRRQLLRPLLGEARERLEVERGRIRDAPATDTDADADADVLTEVGVLMSSRQGSLD
jgi:hypothetical protein